MNNRRIAELMRQVADLLEDAQGATPRVRAWRQAAAQIADHGEEMTDVFRARGRAGLEAIPHVGTHLSAVIIELLRTGRCAALDRLRGETTPADRFARVPGVGPALGERIHQELGISTLEELEVAAHDGSLRTVPGFGPRRVAAISDVLATRLAHRPPHLRAEPPSAPPPIALLLDIDRLYRKRAAAGELTKIAPRRFNPGHEAWLPLMREHQGDWVFTALYSNTALAHRLRRTRDWVVLYYHQPGRDEHSATVVTETVGPLRGRRVIRGRERECARHYRMSAAAQALQPPGA